MTTLRDRGIHDAAAMMEWQEVGPGVLNGVIISQPGWIYPSFVTVDDVPVYRYKNADSSQKPKYLWIPKGIPKENLPKYYFHPDVDDYIAQASGECYIASGEPDVLAYHAAGQYNVLSCYGEGNVPETLAADLMSLGVIKLFAYPDRDAAGQRWAQRIYSLLSGTPVEFFPRVLPEALGEKGDINKLWMAVSFDTIALWDVLLDCPDMVIEAQQLPLDTPAGEGKGWEDLPEQFRHDMEREALARGGKSFNGEGWTKNFPCPMHNHEHDKYQPGFGFNRLTGCGKCFKDGETIKAKELGELWGIHLKDYFDRPARKESASADKKEKVPPPPLRIISWSDATKQALAILSGDVTPFESIPIPFKQIAKFGGFAELLPARKMGAVVADSGDGKTTFIESLLDKLRIKGFSAIMYGPEWSYIEYVLRAIQREGGPSMMQLMRYQDWLAEDKRGIPLAARRGFNLTPQQKADAERLAGEIDAWPGKLYFVDSATTSIKRILDSSTEIVQDCAKRGERVSLLVCDYLQLMEGSGDKTSERVDKASAQIKQWIANNNMSAFVGSQVTKQDGRTSAQGDKKMDQNAIHFGRSFHFNLVLTINRRLDGNGIKLPEADFRIAKNSMGGQGDGLLYLNVDRQMWVDGVSEKGNIDSIAFGEEE